ncbi:hypothetical protein EGW08_006188, partial [Elysia chlorotica]
DYRLDGGSIIHSAVTVNITQVREAGATALLACVSYNASGDLDRLDKDNKRMAYVLLDFSDSEFWLWDDPIVKVFIALAVSVCVVLFLILTALVRWFRRRRQPRSSPDEFDWTLDPEFLMQATAKGAVSSQKKQKCKSHTTAVSRATRHSRIANKPDDSRGPSFESNNTLTTYISNSTEQLDGSGIQQSFSTAITKATMPKHLFFGTEIR